MKTNKFFAGLMMVAALAMVSCEEKKNNEIIIPGGGGGGEEVAAIPELDAPEEGYVTVVINIPAGSECNGICFKGTLNGTDWSGADTYIGLDNAAVSADEAIKFAPVEGFENWYAATYKMGEVGLRGKICLVYSGDASWEGQAVDWEIDETNSTVLHSISDDGNIQIDGTNGLLYVAIGGWQKSECVEVVLVDYNITVLTPEFCEPFDIELVGSFEGWGTAPVALTKVEEGKYTATIKAAAKEQVKVRGVGGWDKEIHTLNAETGEWGGAPNFELTEETTVTMDYSDAAQYRWNICAE